MCLKMKKEEIKLARMETGTRSRAEAVKVSIMAELCRPSRSPIPALVQKGVSRQLPVNPFQQMRETVGFFNWAPSIVTGPRYNFGGLGSA